MTHFTSVKRSSDAEESSQSKDGTSGAAEKSNSEAKAGGAVTVAKGLSFLTLGIVLLQICCEVSKQVTIYSVQYLNHGKYPVPQTFMVVAMETMKLVATVVRSSGEELNYRSISLISR